MKQSISFVVILLVFSFSSSAQTPVEDSIFIVRQEQQEKKAEKDKETRSERKRNYKDVSSVVKLSLLSPLAGTFSAHFEQKLFSSFSLQAGGGISFTNFTAHGLFANNIVSQVNFTPGITYILNEYDFYNRTHRSYSAGYTFSAEPRYYFERHGIQGFFAGLMFSGTRYNIASKKILPTASTLNTEPEFGNDTFKENEVNNDFFITVGNQAIYKRLTFEYGIGGGFRKTTALKYIYENISAYKFADGYANLESSKTVIMISLKLGYHF